MTLPQTPDGITHLTDLETTLGAVAAEIATALADPPCDDRRQTIRVLWRQIEAHRSDYAAAVQALRSSAGQPNSDTPIMAAARRQLMWHGPARVSHWDQIAAMVSRQLLPSSFPPLISERSEIVRGPEFGAVNYMMDVLFRLSNPLSADRDILPDTHYHDIPLSGVYFIDLLTAARRVLLAQGHSDPVRFLDMGCGGGTKVLAASAMFETAHGAELSPAYVTEAQSFFTRVGADPGQINQADALKFEGYGDYDVIYFYRPLKDPALAAQMEARVLEQVRPGTILLAPLNVTLGRGDTGAVRVIDKVYLAHTPRDVASDLGDLAETKGCETRITAPHQDEMLGFWSPIVQQSRRNGFALY